MNKCRDLNVPAGPLLGELKRGNDVTLQCGKLVKSSDVTEPSDPGRIFLGNFFFWDFHVSI